MSILSRLPHEAMYGPVICDYLNVSIPLGDMGALRESLEPIVEALGAFETFDEGWRLFESRQGRLAASGVLKLSSRGKVAICSASGQVLQRLRNTGLFSEFLSALGAYPHRVTMLHATADYLCDGPRVIPAVFDAANAGELALTRKKIKPGQSRAFLGANSEGAVTGTVYLGQRKNADVWAKIYDKREERLSAGFPDPGPMVRVEVAILSDMGATLRDAADPYAIFFKFAGRSLVEVPVEWSGWEPQGEGYVLEPKVQRTLFERMTSIVSNSLDVSKLVALAAESAGFDEVKALDTLRFTLRPVLRGFLKARGDSLQS